ncbi:hypothetical protein [Streptomyces noursei]
MRNGEVADYRGYFMSLPAARAINGRTELIAHFTDDDFKVS